MKPTKLVLVIVKKGQALRVPSVTIESKSFFGTAVSLDPHGSSPRDTSSYEH